MINLREIILQYPTCLSDSKRFKSILSDYYPGEKRMINLLTILLEAGIPDRLSSSGWDDLYINNLIMHINNNYGIMEKYIQEALLIWGSAYNLVLPPSRNISFLPYSQDSVPKLTKIITGTVQDFDIIEKKGGYYIKRYKGTDEEITIPNMINGKRIVGIGEAAFKHCFSIRRVTISEGIEVIENSAFELCVSLHEVTLPSTLKIIGSETEEIAGAFESTKINKINLPESVTYIGPYTFHVCSDLQSIKLPDIMETINEGAFYGCSKLSEIIFPKNLKIIGDSAFRVCHLSVVKIPYGTEQILGSAFLDSGVTEIHIPSTVTKIAYRALGLTELPVVYCEHGSEAMKYAEKNHIPYILT